MPAFPCNAFPHFILHFSPFSFLLYYSERKPFDFFIIVIFDFLHDSLIFHLILKRMSKGVLSIFPPRFYSLSWLLALSSFLFVVLRLNNIFTLKLSRSVIECNYCHSNAFHLAFSSLVTSRCGDQAPKQMKPVFSHGVNKSKNTAWVYFFQHTPIW